MARTNLPLSVLTASSPSGAFADLNDAGTVIDQANGMNVQLPTSSVPANAEMDSLLLYVTNTYAGTAQVTVRAGAGPVPAFRSGEGDFVTGNLTASTGTAFIGPFDVSRFIQTDGSLNIDFSASMTGKIWAVLIPRAF